MTDGLALHLYATNKIDWLSEGQALGKMHNCLRSIAVDGQLNYIRKFDGPRGESREYQMTQALKMVRFEASEERILNFQFLKELHCIVLNVSEVEFRKNTAFAKEGLEKYKVSHETEGIFCEKIEKDYADNSHPIVKAVRVYLDICFFHPFSDGNSRLARLLFEYYLTKAELALATYEPIFALPRFAGQVEDYRGLLRLAFLLCRKKTTALPSHFFSHCRGSI